MAFPKYDLREVLSLHGVWSFAFLGDKDADEVNVGALDPTERMIVPGCFDATPMHAGDRGLAAYRTTIRLEEGAHYRIVFDSVHLWCRVYVQGELIGEHAGGFTRFGFDFTGAWETEIVVLVDNRIDYERCPIHLGYFDWYHYGGLSGSVAVHKLDNMWIDSVRIVTEDAAARRVRLTVDYGSTVRSADLTITCDGETLVGGENVPLSGNGTIQRTFELEGAALWSPDTPELHTLHVKLGDDDTRTRFGIRTVTTENGQILINGEAVQLLGFNRHRSHPEFGHALPDAILLDDLHLLVNMGCNFVRGSHYPQGEAFLELCDELGICVWNEATGWQHTADHLNDPHFLEAEKRNIEEMIAVGENHPSVIMWGLLNESVSHEEEARSGYETLIGHIRASDPTRPVTYASNHVFDDVCLDLVDIISVNCYPGWYIGDVEGIPDFLDGVVDCVDASGHAQKPLIISEIGAGAVPGWRDNHHDRWTEQYQARLLETVIRHMFFDRSRFCGLAIWQFCDLRVSDEVGRILFRPRGFNNKGVVDEYRRPKLAYETVRALFRELSE